jgi:flagellar biosynthesis/type III secretory pathway M-ring protein FliF/YscJ
MLYIILVVIFITIISLGFIIVRQYHNPTREEKSKGQDYNSDGNKSQENAKEPEPESKDFYSYPDNEFFSGKEIIKSEEENRNKICEESNLKP